MERPLIVMTPKSLLRFPAASSSIDDLASGGFRPLIDDAEIADRDAVEKIVLCSGKVYYDLAEARKKTEDRKVAIVRLEQFYPFPTKSLRETLAIPKRETARMDTGRAAEHGRLDVRARSTQQSTVRRTERLRQPGDRLLQHSSKGTGRSRLTGISHRSHGLITDLIRSSSVFICPSSLYCKVLDKTA